MLLWWSVGLCEGADADWMGRTRDEVVAELGKPVSVLQRGETQVLMYANSVRVEIRDEVVVGFRSGDSAVIVKSDGSRYVATERGRVQRVVTDSTADEDESAADAGASPQTVVRQARPREAAASDAVASPASTPNTEPERELAALPASATLLPEESLDETTAAEDEELLPAEEPMESVVENDPATQALENFVATGVLPGAADEEAEEEPSATAHAVEVAILALLRFGFAVLMLRIAISWVELPCYMPDVLKVAALYTAVREGMHGLGELGGHWEWIPLFRLDDGVSFLALVFLLYKFKIALAGITALKIACATKLVTYFLMLIAGVAISFGLSSL